MIDIIDIKQAVKTGQLFAYVKNNKIYLENNIGECVEIGEDSPIVFEHSEYDPIDWKPNYPST